MSDNVDSLANQNIIELKVTNDDIKKETEKFSSHEYIFRFEKGLVDNNYMFKMEEPNKGTVTGDSGYTMKQLLGQVIPYLNKKYKMNESFLDSESKKRMNEQTITVSSEEKIEYFKNFLTKYYSDFRDKHKNDSKNSQSAISTLLGDLTIALKTAIREFWFE